MDRADYWLYWHDNHARRLLQTIMGCVWPWTQIILKSCWLTSKRYKVYSRSSSESTYCILFLNFLVLTCLSWIFWIFWSDSVHHSGKTRSFVSLTAGLLGASGRHGSCALCLGAEFFVEKTRNAKRRNASQVATCVPVMAAWRKSWLPSNLFAPTKHTMLTEMPGIDTIEWNNWAMITWWHSQYNS